MRTRKTIACIISMVLFALCISVNANAKVIEPEVVKTEKWVTLYYLDDDLEEPYPFIRCEADIYNDGTVKLYLWNMHEWDGFATVSHRATIIQTIPEKHSNISEDDFSRVKELDVSYYPTEYSLAHSGYNYGFDRYNRNYSSTSADGTVVSRSFGFLRYYSPLPKMPFYESRPANPVYTFKPAEDPTGTYEFRLFGHDITITPELLSGKIVPTPTPDEYQTITYRNGSAITRLKADTDLSDIQDYINQLESENARLKQETADLEAQLGALKGETPDNRIGDIDSSGDITIRDVHYLLRYYTELRVSKTTTDSLAIWFGNYESSKE